MEEKNKIKCNDDDDDILQRGARVTVVIRLHDKVKLMKKKGRKRFSCYKTYYLAQSMS